MGKPEHDLESTTGPRSLAAIKNSASDLGSAGIENLKESPKMTNPRTSRGFIVSGCGSWI